MLPMPEAQGAPNPQQPTSYKPQRFNWKNALLMFLIGATVIFAGISTYYFLQLNSTTPTPQLKPPKVSSPSATTKPEQPTVTPDETADWKVYNDNKLKFQIKYPSTWSVKVEDQKSVSPEEQDVIYQRLVTLKKGKGHIKILEGGALGFGGEVPKTKTLKIGDNDLDFDFYTFSDDQFGYMGKEDLKLPDRNEVVGFFIVVGKKNFNKDLSEIKNILATFKFLE